MRCNNTRSFIWGFVLLLVLIFSGCQDESAPTPDQAHSFLALGDSYTIGESVPEDQRWPVQLADSLQNHGITIKEPKIIAKTGWTTADLIAAISDEKEELSEHYDLVSLLIGVNNQYQGLDFDQFEKEFEELLMQAISFADGDTQQVFVVSIPDYGATPFGQKRNPDQIAEQLDRYNNTARQISEQHDVTFINITPISKDAEDQPELTAEDNLHPSGKMYQRWVSEMLPSIKMKLQ
jgi:lysophospholipase L1-like esterase